MKLSKPATAKKAIWRSKWIWILFILVLAGGGAAWYFLVGGKSAQAQSAAQDETAINTTTVTRGDIKVSADGSGTLIASQSVDLSFSTQGTVTELNVKVGDTVKEGDVLARMEDTQDLEANVASIKLQLLEAEKTLAELQENADVSFAQAYQDWITAKETYNTALTTSQRTAYARCGAEVNAQYKLNLDRTTEKLNELTSKDYGSEAWIEANNNYQTARANYNYCIAYTSTEKTDAQASLDIAKISLEQAESKYNTLKDASGIDPDELAIAEARVTAYKTQLENAQEDLEGTTLIAPIDGKIVYLAASKGAIVGTSKFITVADVTHPTLEVSVDEADANVLTIGSTATAVFDALPDVTYTGKVVLVEPQLTTSGQYQVNKGRVELDEDSVKTVQNLPLAMNATVEIINKETKDALLVPVTALKSLENDQYAVFVVSADGELIFTSVEVGMMDDTYAEIISGLNDGDVISTGVTQMKSSSGSSTSN